MPKSFDHVVTHREPKTGRVLEVRDYVLHIGPNGMEYEQPPKSGIFYAPNGDLLRDEGAKKRAEELASRKLAAEKAEKDEAEREEKEREAMRAELRKELEAELKAKK